MEKSAKDVMQEIIFSAVVDSISALRDASNGMPNVLLREFNAINSNVTFTDLPKEMQTSINDATRSAFNRLLKEGYAVSPEKMVIKMPRRNDIPKRSPNRRGP